MAYGTTYGVDALTSGKFGDYLVNNNILDAETVDFLKIPTDSSLSGLGEGVTANLLDGTTPTFNTSQILS